ncbi:MAG: geranylgeranyl reductase family protein [Alphaproteobacteria bacterium]|nr:geranylgeranyl reductase family protein [Alphaproteobacteria bacterium]
MADDSRDKYDLVVIGGGPAGSAAAITAAKNSLRVCLIDKQIFPRNKLCGGLITQRSKSIFEKVFEKNWDPQIINYSNEVSFYSEGKLLSELNGYSRLYFSMRIDFDHYLLELAREAGSQLILGKSVDEIDFSQNLVKLADGAQIEYDSLVGADGVNSTVAKLLFGSSFNKKTIGFGLEVEVPRTDLPSQSEKVEIDFGIAVWGYGWVFPKKDSYTIGVGGIHRINPDLKSRLAYYLSLKGLNVDNYKVKGQFIPFGDYRKSPGRGNVLLCGDAAGLVDPITGEGIAYAMENGHIAARSICMSINSSGRDAALALYKEDYLKISNLIKQAKFWRLFIFPQIIRKSFSWAFADAGTLQRGYLDILAGKHEYNALYRLFLIQAWRGIKKLARKIFRRDTK